MDLKAEAQQAADYNNDTKKLGAERIEFLARTVWETSLQRAGKKRRG